MDVNEQYAGLLAGLDHVAVETVAAYERGEIDLPTFVDLSIRISAGIVELRRGEVGPRAQAAIEEMRSRVKA